MMNSPALNALNLEEEAAATGEPLPYDQPHEYDVDVLGRMAEQLQKLRQPHRQAYPYYGSPSPHPNSGPFDPDTSLRPPRSGTALAMSQHGGGLDRPNANSSSTSTSTSTSQQRKNMKQRVRPRPAAGAASGTSITTNRSTTATARSGNQTTTNTTAAARTSAKSRAKSASSFRSPRPASSEKMLLLLQRYANRNHHCNVPSNHLEDGQKLGVWLDAVRRVRARGRLGDAVEEKMEELGVIWNDDDEEDGVDKGGQQRGRRVGEQKQRQRQLQQRQRQWQQQKQRKRKQEEKDEEGQQERRRRRRQQQQQQQRQGSGRQYKKEEQQQRTKRTCKQEEQDEEDQQEQRNQQRELRKRYEQPRQQYHQQQKCKQEVEEEEDQKEQRQQQQSQQREHRHVLQRAQEIDNSASAPAVVVRQHYDQQPCNKDDGRSSSSGGTASTSRNSSRRAMPNNKTGAYSYDDTPGMMVRIKMEDTNDDFDYDYDGGDDDGNSTSNEAKALSVVSARNIDRDIDCAATPLTAAAAAAAAAGGGGGEGLSLADRHYHQQHASHPAHPHHHTGGGTRDGAASSLSTLTSPTHITNRTADGISRARPSLSNATSSASAKGRLSFCQSRSNSCLSNGDSPGDSVSTKEDSQHQHQQCRRSRTTIDAVNNKKLAPATAPALPAPPAALSTAPQGVPALPPFNTASVTTNASSSQRPEPQQEAQSHDQGQEQQSQVPLHIPANVNKNSPWEVKFALVAEYKRVHGTADVPVSYKHGDVALGRWLAQQRQNKRRGTLKAENKALLDGLGISWIVKPTKRKKGKTSLAASSTDYEPHFHEVGSRPTITATSIDDANSHGSPESCSSAALAASAGIAAVGTGQKKKEKGRGRASKKKAAAATADPDGSPPKKKRRKLRSLSPAQEEHWGYMLGLLKQFRQREGHVTPLKRHMEDGEPLGTWLVKQKFKHRHGNLGETYIQRLEAEGVVWEVLEETWQQMLLLFKQFVSREGHGRVPQPHVENGKRLGTWVVNQRKLMKEGKLADERVRALDAAGIDWDPHGSSWQKFYALSEQFALREGHTKVRADHQENGEFLHRWLRRQKKLKHEDKLSQEQERRLKQLTGWSWELGESWDDMYALLLQFKECKGHCNVPSKHLENGKKLGVWLDKHKQDKRNGRLDPEIQDRLESVGVQWELHEAQWEQYYLLLLQFVEREGHADVLQRHVEEGEKLGTWVSTQRIEFKKGKLSRSRQERLERIGFIWQKRRGRYDSVANTEDEEDEGDGTECYSEGDEERDNADGAGVS